MKNSLLLTLIAAGVSVVAAMIAVCAAKKSKGWGICDEDDDDWDDWDDCDEDCDCYDCCDCCDDTDEEEADEKPEKKKLRKIPRKKKNPMKKTKLQMIRKINLPETLY